jgi:hypothetical protein
MCLAQVCNVLQTGTQEVSDAPPGMLSGAARGIRQLSCTRGTQLAHQQQLLCSRAAAIHIGWRRTRQPHTLI